MKGRISQPFSPMHECDSLQSHTYLFISHFLPPLLRLMHIMKLWKSHFLSKGSWLPWVTRVLSVPRVISLTGAITGGKGGRRESEGGRQDQILHFHPPLLQKWGSPQCIGIMLLRPVSPASLVWNEKLSESR